MEQDFTLTLPSPFRENLQGEPIEGEEFGCFYEGDNHDYWQLVDLLFKVI